jgi:hypothetical protein
MKRPAPAAFGAAAAVLLAAGALVLRGSPADTTPPAAPAPAVALLPAPPPVDSAALERERLLADSVRGERERAEAAERRRTGPRLEISLQAKRLWWLTGQDTVFSAPVAVGKGTGLEWDGRRWKFNTPRGERTVLAKERDPVWTPPLWHYVEVAKKKEYKLVELKRGQEVVLGDSTRLVIRGDTVGQLRPDSIWVPIPQDQEILFDETVFVPPIGTVNRRIEGELGKFKLDMGDGYLLHGTRDSTSIGTAATHGCIRVGDRDLERIFKTVPVGTPVFIR